MRVRSSIAIVGAAALALTGLAVAAQEHSLPPVAVAHFAPGAAPVPFELFRGSRIFLHGSVNGRPAEIMLDSGSSLTLLDADFATSIALPGGMMMKVRAGAGDTQGRVVPDTTLAVGGLRLDQATVVVLDLSATARAVGHKIDVVLGRDAFESGIVDLDFEKSELRFVRSTDFAAPAGAVRLPMSREHGIRQVPIAIGNHAPVLADFDLGNGGSVMIAQPDWQGDPQLSALRSVPTQARTAGGISERRMTTLPSITFAGQRFEKVPALLNLDPDDPPVTGANIGIDLLQRFRLAIDFNNNALYLTPVPAALARPLPKDRLGMHYEFADGKLKVAYVSPDGPAAAAGWKVGDAIAAIGEVKVGDDFFRSRYANLTQLPAGTRLDFVRADGTHQPVVLRDYF